jgi:Spy/CpxP family protein refolding chaperone
MKKNFKIAVWAMCGLCVWPISSSATVDFKPAEPVVKLMPVLMDNLDLMNLSSEQLSKVREISRQNFQELEFLNAEYHDVKSELKELLYDSELHKKQVAALAKKLSEMELKRLSLTIDCVENLKQVLTPIQHEELMNLVNF